MNWRIFLVDSLTWTYPKVGQYQLCWRCQSSYNHTTCGFTTLKAYLTNPPTTRTVGFIRRIDLRVMHNKLHQAHDALISSSAPISSIMHDCPRYPKRSIPKYWENNGTLVAFWFVFEWMVHRYRILLDCTSTTDWNYSPGMYSLPLISWYDKSPTKLVAECPLFVTMTQPSLFYLVTHMSNHQSSWLRNLTITDGDDRHE